MEDSLLERISKNKKNSKHIPDVLSCLANLSNDEVFTPPEVVNQMLDMLPQELFKDPNIKFLDPAAKTGVFLREITKRLIVGLEPIYPNLRERIGHILHNQVFGIAITELTSLLSRRSLYCSKYPNGRYSVTQFNNAEGNIRFKRVEHIWRNGTCIMCGANEDQWNRNDSLETYAYEFIHTNNPEDIFRMKFDVIIGNPPYQLKDGGGNTGMSAKPIYQLFIERAKKLNPRYLSMIIPSRWFSGGKGLDNFRQDMLTDHKIKILVDYENYKDVFPTLSGLAGGVCYFLWDKQYNGECKVINKTSESENISIRSLDEFPTFIRSNTSIDIVRKVLKNHDGEYLDKRISSRLPFDIPTTYIPKEKGVPCYFTQKVGKKYVDASDVTDNYNYFNKWKFLIPKAPIAGQTDFTKPVGFYYDGNTRIAKPGEVCSESWLVAGAFDSEKETQNYKTYIMTKIVRFLLLQTVVSQNITKKNFSFVPDVEDYSKSYTDKELCDKWNISDIEYNYICSRIGEIGGE